MRARGCPPPQHSTQLLAESGYDVWHPSLKLSCSIFVAQDAVRLWLEALYVAFQTRGFIGE